MSAGAAPVFEAAVPILSVGDLGPALDFYERVLGFRVEWEYGDPSHLASLCRDRVEVNLSKAVEAQSMRSKVYFPMAGVDAYYAALVAAGTKVAVPLADRPYGMRDFRIIDPAGNEVSFGESLHE